MRIWFAAAIPPTAYGGVHRSMNQLAAELRRYGHTVSIIYDTSRRPGRRLRFSCILALRLLIIFWKRPHWIIARSTDGCISALLVRLFNLPTRVALHNHGWEERVAAIERRLPSSLLTNPTTWRARLAGFAMLRLTLAHAAVGICGTVDEARWIRNRHRRCATPLAVIPNGIDPVEVPFWPEQTEYPPSILMVGGFTWKKNLEYGIDLFRRIVHALPSARLFLVGCGQLSLQKKRLLQPLGDSLFIVESEAPSRMNRWYESCPVVLFPSRYEGGRPFTVLEAQSRGCVVFGSNLPSIRECITHGVNGRLLTGVNPAADADAVVKVLSDAAGMRRIGNAAWRSAMRHTIRRQGKRCNRLLSRIAAEYARR
jgi:glycosyltransferase involved in cell wall biosynthesis